MHRRLHHEQPESFAFTPANLEWAQGQIAKYPEGRQASAVIPLLWRAQEQEGWVSRPIVETVAEMLGLAEIRVLEVATFYFMFQLRPVGSVAHVQVCGTTSCMICGAEDLVAVCRERIATRPFDLSPDGKFSWEEVECLGACANAPMVQIGKDYYEDLDRESLGAILDQLAAGEVPRPGSARGRWASEPLGGRTSLDGAPEAGANGSVEAALGLGDTLRRIDGTEATVTDLVLGRRPANAITRPEGPAPRKEPPAPPPDARRVETERGARQAKGRPKQGSVAPEPATATAADAPAGTKPKLRSAPKRGGADDLTRIKGVGPKLRDLMHELGIFHFEQIASWTEAEIAWVDDRLKFHGRIERDGWVAQAQALAAGKGDS